MIEIDHTWIVTKHSKLKFDAETNEFYLGKYQWSDGSVYSGDWEDNKIVGYGIYTWIDGRKYEGNWENNFMHGKGKYSWQDGRNYEGNYHQDKKEGYGIYTWVKKIYLGWWQIIYRKLERW